MEKNIFEKQSEESIYEEIIEEKSLPFFFEKIINQINLEEEVFTKKSLPKKLEDKNLPKKNEETVFTKKSLKRNHYQFSFEKKESWKKKNLQKTI